MKKTVKSVMTALAVLVGLSALAAEDKVMPFTGETSFTALNPTYVNDPSDSLNRKTPGWYWGTTITWPSEGSGVSKRYGSTRDNALHVLAKGDKVLFSGTPEISGTKAVIDGDGLTVAVSTLDRMESTTWYGWVTPEEAFAAQLANEDAVMTLKLSGANSWLDVFTTVNCTVPETTFTMAFTPNALHLVDNKGIVWFPAVATNAEGKVYGDLNVAIKTWGTVNCVAAGTISEAITVETNSTLVLNKGGYMVAGLNYLTLKGGTFDFNPAEAGCTIAQGYKAEQQGEVWKVVLNHEHQWSYAVTAEGKVATLTAKCVSEHCTLEAPYERKATITLSEGDKQYDGKAITAELKQDADFEALTGITLGEIEYEGNATDAGTYKFSVAAEGTEKDFAISVTISPRDIAAAAITLSETSLNYKGTYQTIEISEVKLGDLDVTYEEAEGESVRTAKAIGTYTVKINGTGNYSGSASTTWQITNYSGALKNVAMAEADIGKLVGTTLTVTNSAKFTYDADCNVWYAGLTLTWEATAKDYELTEYGYAIFTKPGLAQMTIGDVTYTGEQSLVLDGSKLENVRDSLTYKKNLGNEKTCTYLKTTIWSVKLTQQIIEDAKTASLSSITGTLYVGALPFSESDNTQRSPGIEFKNYTIVIPIDENLKLYDQHGNQVYPNPGYVAQIEETQVKYLELKDAVEAATTGQTITALAQCGSGDYSLATNATLNLSSFGDKNSWYCLVADDEHMAAKVTSSNEEQVKSMSKGFAIQKSENEGTYAYTIYREHLHLWETDLDGATLRAECTNEVGECDLEEPMIGISLTVTDNGDGAEPTFTIVNRDEFLATVNKFDEVAEIGEITVQRTTDDGAAYDKWYKGNYIASCIVKMNGEPNTITNAFVIGGAYKEGGYVVASRGIRYDSLSEAVTAASAGDTITYRDGNLDQRQYYFNVDKDLTIDFGGATFAYTGTDGDMEIYNNGAGTLTMQNLKVSQPVHTSVFGVDQYHNVSLLGGNFMLGSGFQCVNASSDFTVNVVDVKVAVTNGIYLCAFAENGAAEVEISGGNYSYNDHCKPQASMIKAGCVLVTRTAESVGNYYTVIPHEHDYYYEANGNVITLKCKGEGYDGCEKMLNPQKLTLTATNALEGAVYAGASYKYDDGFLFDGKDSVEPVIEYYEDGMKVGTPTTFGDYEARVKVTINGNSATAVAAFKLTHAHLFTFNVNPAATLTATCENDVSDCDIPGNQTNITLTVTGLSDGVAPTFAIANKEAFLAIVNRDKSIASIGEIQTVRLEDDGAETTKWYVGKYRSTCAVTANGATYTLTNDFSIAKAGEYTKGWTVGSRDIRYDTWDEALVAAKDGDTVYYRDGDREFVTHEFSVGEKNLTLDFAGASLTKDQYTDMTIKNSGSGTLIFQNVAIKQPRGMMNSGQIKTEGNIVFGTGVQVVNTATSESNYCTITVDSGTLLVSNGLYQCGFAADGGTIAISGGKYWQYDHPGESGFVSKDCVVREIEGDYKYEVLAHSHLFAYRAQGDVITLVCTNLETAAQCAYNLYPQLLTLVATNAYYTGSMYAGASTVVSNQFRVGEDTLISDIGFYDKSGPLQAAPTEVGDYTAKVSVTYDNVMVTAEKDFSILHTHLWKYSADKETVTATCMNAACTVSGNPTATLKVPNATTNYTGSVIEPATFVKGTDFEGEAVISYEPASPKNVGEYWVKATVGEAVASNKFTIVQTDIANVSAKMETEEFNFTSEEIFNGKLGSAKLGGYELTEADYMISGTTNAFGSGYSNCTYTVTLTGQGNFKGTKELTWTIKAPTRALGEMGRGDFEVDEVLYNDNYGECDQATRTLNVSATTNIVFVNGAWFVGMTVDLPTDIDWLSPTASVLTDDDNLRVTVSTTGETYTGTQIRNGEVENAIFQVVDGDHASQWWSGIGTFQYFKKIRWFTEVSPKMVEKALFDGKSELTFTMTVGGLTDRWEGLKYTDFTIKVPLQDFIFKVREGETADIGNVSFTTSKILLEDGSIVTNACAIDYVVNKNIYTDVEGNDILERKLSENCYVYSSETVADVTIPNVEHQTSKVVKLEGEEIDPIDADKKTYRVHAGDTLTITYTAEPGYEPATAERTLANVEPGTALTDLPVFVWPDVPVTVEAIEHATIQVYTNEVLIGAAPCAVASNEMVTVIYLADEGYFFYDASTKEYVTSNKLATVKADTNPTTVSKATALPLDRAVAMIDANYYPTMDIAYKAAQAGDTIMIVTNTVATLQPAEGGIPDRVTVQGVAEKTTVTTGFNNYGGFGNHTFRNIRFACTDSAIYNCNPSDGKILTFADCEFVQREGYALMFEDECDGTVVVTNCTITGEVYIPTDARGYFVDTVFAGKGATDSCAINVQLDTVFDRCIFADEYADKQSGICSAVILSDTITVMLNGCALTNGSPCKLSDVFNRNKLGFGVIDGVTNSAGLFTSGTVVANQQTLLDTKVAPECAAKLVDGETDVYTIVSAVAQVGATRYDTLSNAVVVAVNTDNVVTQLANVAETIILENVGDYFSLAANGYAFTGKVTATAADRAIYEEVESGVTKYRVRNIVAVEPQEVEGATCEVVYTNVVQTMPCSVWSNDTIRTETVTIRYIAKEGYVFEDNTLTNEIKDISASANPTVAPSGQLKQTYAVVAKVVNAASETTYHYSLDQAFSGCQDGDTVVLLADGLTTENIALSSEGSVNLDLNDHILTNGEFRVVNGPVTVKDSAKGNGVLVNNGAITVSGPWSLIVSSAELAFNDKLSMNLTSALLCGETGKLVWDFTNKAHPYAENYGSMICSDGSKCQIAYDETLTNGVYTLIEGSGTLQGLGSFTLANGKTEKACAVNGGWVYLDTHRFQITQEGGLVTLTVETNPRVRFDQRQYEVPEGQSVKVYVLGNASEKAVQATVTYQKNTGAYSAAYVDGKRVSFPLTLNWVKGEVAAKEILFQTTATSRYDAEDRFFTLQIGSQVGEPGPRTAEEIDDGGEVCTVKIVDAGEGVDPDYVRALAWPAHGGTVTGGGTLAKATSYRTLTAKTKNGSTFVGWYRAKADNPEVIDFAAPVDPYSAKNPRQIRVGYDTENAAGTYFAYFTDVLEVAEVIEPKPFDETGKPLDGVVGVTGWAEEACVYSTMVGVKFALPVDFADDSGAGRLSISKLPSGLTYSAKKGLISGVPTKAGTYTAKFVASNQAGKHTVSYTFIVDAIPTAAVGTFAGVISDDTNRTGIGSVQFTAGKTGSLSAKVVRRLSGQRSFSVKGYNYIDENTLGIAMTNSANEVFEATLSTTNGWYDTFITGEAFGGVKKGTLGYNDEDDGDFVAVRNAFAKADKTAPEYTAAQQALAAYLGSYSETLYSTNDFSAVGTVRYRVNAQGSVYVVARLYKTYDGARAVSSRIFSGTVAAGFVYDDKLDLGGAAAALRNGTSLWSTEVFFDYSNRDVTGKARYMRPNAVTGDDDVDVDEAVGVPAE